jgi:hypothetical protein
MKRFVLDIETKTDFKTLRLVGLLEEDSPVCSIRYGETKRSAYNMLATYPSEGDIVFTWNGEGFDYPVLAPDVNVKKLEEDGIRLIDGYVISKMLYPDRYSHSLASWLKEIGEKDEQKLEVDYDNAPLAELQAYLDRDLFGTLKVCNKLWEEWCAICANTGGDAYRIVRMEQGIRRLVNVSRDRGYGFDLGKAISLECDLRKELEALDTIASAHLPEYLLPKTKMDFPPKVQIRKDGTLSATMQAWLARNGIAIYKHIPGTKAIYYGPGSAQVLTIPVTAPLKTHRKLSLTNQKEIKQWLQDELGWKPTMWNMNKDKKRTSPMMFDKVTGAVCPNLKTVCPDSLLKCLRGYSVAKSRLGVVQGLIERHECDEEGYPLIRADADTCGTPTARFKHRNIVNIPRVTTAWGREMRELFRPVNRDNVQVGWDASSLEAVMEAHYVYPFDKDYAEELVKGDVHQRNIDNLGFPNRDTAKRFKYAITYGARPKKLAQTLGVTEKQAQRWYDDFWNVNHGLKALMDYLVKFWKSTGKRYIIGIDRRPLFVRHEHAILNTLLQGSGAILMKYAYLIANNIITKNEIVTRWSWPLIRYHDEEQWETNPEYAEDIGQLGVLSIELAGKALDLRVPITGEYKVGANWAECH